MVGGVNSYLGAYYSMAQSGGVNSVSQVFDYKAAQKQTKALIDKYQAGGSEVKALKDDAAKFLNDYTRGMNALNKAATNVTGANLDKLLYNKAGEVTDDTVKKTTDAVQSMVDEYNSSLKMLNDNYSRGAGVEKQLFRMAGDPASKEAMEMLGVTVNKDATLSLDVTKLTEALKTGNKDQLKLVKDVLGGSTGLAAGVQKDARAGLNTSAGSLVGNDIAKMQSIQQDDPIRSFYTYSRSGAYAMNNMAAGFLMNFAV